MYRFFHCTTAVLCAVGACVFFYLTFVQHPFYIVFAITGMVLSKLSYNEYRAKAQNAVIISPAPKKVEIISKECGKREVCEFEDILRFRKENEALLSQLSMEYKKYVAEEFGQQRDYPIALTYATEKMMLKYGDDIYSAFRDPVGFMHLSPSMYIANLDAARKFVATLKYNRSIV